MTRTLPRAVGEIRTGTGISTDDPWYAAVISEFPGSTAVDTAPDYRRTTLELTQGTEAGAVWFDWDGPYLHDDNCDDDEECLTYWEERVPIVEVNFAEWRMESSTDRALDLLGLEWHDSTPLRFVFHSADGTCEGQPTVACTTADARWTSNGIPA